MRVLLVSTYELGNQPLALATPAAHLEAAGHQVRCVDVAVDAIAPDDIDWAERVGLSVPMHTAMRLALAVARVIRSRRPDLPLCFYGLYATVSGDLTLRNPGDAVIAGEFEPGLVAWAGGHPAGDPVQLGRTGPAPAPPSRRLLPPLDRYTRLEMGDERRLVGSTAASRGCSHRCRHCPVPVIYDGRVRPVDEPSVVADVDQLVAAGARHVTFTDPDFLNAPHHSVRVVRAVHARHPGLTFDCTVKVEHILRHRDLWPELAASGCAFVVSAFESVDDPTLAILDKGHTAAEASEAVVRLRAHGIEIRPSWLPFTPWTTVDHLVDLVDFIVAHDLVDNVDPVQLTIRLLVPEGSLLLDRPEMRPHLGPFDAERLGWTWSHPDPSVDALQGEVAALAERGIGHDPTDTFRRIDAVIRSRAGGRERPGLGSVSRGPTGPRAHLTEPWFCCSEPTDAQLAVLAPQA